jgi:hypothetical protein
LVLFPEIVFRTHQIGVSAYPKELLEEFSVLFGIERHEDLNLFLGDECTDVFLQPTSVRLAQLFGFSKGYGLNEKASQEKAREAELYSLLHEATCS